MIKASWHPSLLRFKHPFRIASGMRAETPVVFVELQYEHITGFGEAALPPYLKGTQETVASFFSRIAFKETHHPAETEPLIEFVNGIDENNYPAKAAIDMALHDLKGKLLKKPCYELFNLDKKNTPVTTYTIGMGEPKEIIKKIKESGDFPLLKIKLGGKNDKETIRILRNETDKSFCVDVNQGWNEKELALDLIFYLKENGAVFIEQPLDKKMKDDGLWLKEKSPLPLIADESVQGIDDIEKIKDSFHGINIKLMKCGGMREALRMIEKARGYGLKIMIGCMSESSCGVSAAAQLTPLADWADLDGPLLISNDPFRGIEFEKGKIILSQKPGIGIIKVSQPL